MGDRIQSFRTQLKDQILVIGTFVKTPSPVVCELLSRARLDVICLDAEHAPFGRIEIDGCVAALRAADQPSLVRISADTAADIRNALDAGATGMLVPHVKSVDQAAAIVHASRYGEGGRGYSGSTRAADFAAKGMQAHLRDSGAQTTVIVQIEDLAALGPAAAIAAVEGVDCIFIGRADLAVAMQRDTSAPEVIDAVLGVCAAAKSAGTAIGMFCSDVDEIPQWRAAGVTLFLVGSDQEFILSGARRLAMSSGTRGNTGR
ncbi:MAG TPA: aldolase/citrate lyase family protein [Steroidobacteraceae bacterium]|nr:aldolase/citrate lyase family protein [Steroidobacteraceae bacterium]